MGYQSDQPGLQEISKMSKFSNLKKTFFQDEKKRRHIERWIPERVGVFLERENGGLRRVGVTGGGENFPKKQQTFLDFENFGKYR